RRKSPSKPRRRRVPGIHVLAAFKQVKTWMAGTKPGHDENEGLPIGAQNRPCRLRAGRRRHTMLALLTNGRSHGKQVVIEAVIWDFGGVFTTSPFEAFARFETERGLPADIIRRTNAANHLENAWAKFERAELDIEAFDALFAT